MTLSANRPDNKVARIIGAIFGRNGENIIFPVLGFIAVVFVWSLVSWFTTQNEYPSELPSPTQTLEDSIPYIQNVFSTRRGDEGIFILTALSLGRVAVGFLIATLIAVPLGFWVGTSEKASKMLTPLVQVAKPISPLAWLPIGITIFPGGQNLPAIFVIVITSLWATMINTALGVRNIPNDYWNVSRVLDLTRWQVVTQIMIPSTLPYIFTGMRLSLGTAWLVIVAAEMLTGGTGIGFFVWDVYNTGDISLVILSLVVIGIVGLLLDQLVAWAERKVVGTMK
ncbi:MAG: nitrate ABC transporter permease [Leptolyngbyaceae bacterium]|nr:nitrate ABC transporter permease [Leptolyngbyaceae bacterium]